MIAVALFLILTTPLLADKASPLQSPSFSSSFSSWLSSIPPRRLHPQYVDVSPCPCDLGRGKCDVYCCCDPDCAGAAAAGGGGDGGAKTEQGSLPCLGGLFGGNHSLGKISGHNCSSSERDAMWWWDWRPVACLSGDSTPYLGTFYREEAEPVLDTEARYDVRSRAAKKRSETGETKSSRHSYDRGGGGGDEQPGGVKGTERYTRFSPIPSVYDSARGVVGRWSLPANVLNNGGAADCVPTPVRFLVPSESVCSSEMSDADACAAAIGSYLDPASYSEDAAPFVPAEVGSRKFARVFTAFFKSSESSKFAKYVGTQHGRTPNVADVDLAEEIVDGLKSELDRGKGSRSAVAAVDGGVRYDGPGNSCVNVVLDVKYRIFWRGSTIVRVEKDVLVGDIDISATTAKKQFVTQHFSTSFFHEPDVPPTREVQHISGNPGYIPGKPLLSGVFDEGEDSFSPASDGMMSWKTSESSLCRDAGAQPIAFATDVDSSCSLQIAADNFTDCESLAGSIRLMQDSLLSATHVSKGGNPNATLRSDFVKIVFFDPMEVQQRDNATADNATSGINRTSTTTTEVPPTTAAPLTLPPRQPSLPIASCVVPSRVSVHVMYSKSDTGESKRKTDPIYRVNGIRIMLGHERWDWTCRKTSGEGGDRSCREIANYDIGLSVKFEEIPLVWHHQNTSRFWVLQDVGHCEGDACWAELAYPFTHHGWPDGARTGDDVSFSTLWALILSFLGTAVLVTTSAYW